MTGHQAYRGNQVQTSTPLELVLLAYEALGSALHQALHARKARDFATEAEQVHRALRAISELLNSLDYDQGGQIAINLGSLYAYMAKQLLASQSTTDAKEGEALIEEVIRLADVLRSGWQELKAQQEGAAAAVPPPGAEGKPRMAMAA